MRLATQEINPPRPSLKTLLTRENEKAAQADYEMYNRRMTPMGRPIDEALRDRIRHLLKARKPQAEIARILDKAPSTIAHHVRALGIEAKEYETPNKIGKDGKRRCVECGKRKTPGAFPNERNAVCAACVRGRTKEN